MHWKAVLWRPTVVKQSSLVLKVNQTSQRMSYEEDLRKFKERAIIVLNSQEGWSVCCQFNNQGLIESKSSELYPCTIYRGTLKVKATMQTAKDTLAIIPGSRRLEWDTNFREIKELRKLSETQWIQVSRINGLGKGLISPREFVDICECEQTEDHFLLTGGSIDYPELSSNEKYVRGINGSFGIKLDIDPPGEPDTMVVTFFSETDFKGRIPRAMIDATMSSLVSKTIVNWMKYLELSRDRQIKN